MTETRRPGCLEANMLAEYIDGGLEPRQRADVEEHLAECGECYENFAETAAISAALEGEARSSSPRATARGSKYTWWLSVAAAAAIVVGVGSQNHWWMSRSERQIAELVAATNTRPSEGRLTGGFRWAQSVDTTRSGAAKAAPPEVSIAAAKLEQALSNNRSFDTLRAYGSGQLVLGNLDKAVQAFQDAVAIKSDAEALSDLSAALLARGARDGREIDFAQAAETATRAAAADPKLPEAAFNRAVTLEHLGQDDQAIVAWQTFLALDKTSAWATEARSRLEALKRKTTGPGREASRKRVLDELLPAWAMELGKSPAAQETLRDASALRDQVEAGSPDRFLSDVLASVASSSNPPALARAVAAYGDGWKRYAARNYPAAIGAFRSAEASLSAAGTPFHYSAALGEAVSLFNLQRYEDVIATIDHSQSDLPPNRYPAVRARGLWLKGISLIGLGHQQSGLAAYAEARDGYNAAQEPANAAFLDGLMAEGYTLLGDDEQSWQHRIRALSVAHQSTMFLSAAVAARRSGWDALAGSLQDSAIAAARAARDEGALVDALRERALSYSSWGNTAQATATLAEASSRIADKNGPDFSRLRAEIDLSVARVADPSALQDALEAANRALKFFESAPIAIKLPSAYLARAGVLEAMGDSVRARADLLAGLDRYQEQRLRLAPGPLTASLGDIARELVDRFARLSVAAGDPGAAFAAVDRNRTTAMTMTVTPASLQQHVPLGATVLYFAVSRNETLVWAITSGSVKFHRAALTADQLAPLVDRVADHSDADASRRLAAELLDPVVNTASGTDALFVVPDGPLYRLPFAALTMTDGRFLVAEHAVVVAPSAAWLAAVPAQPSRAAGQLSIAAFGNPAFDRATFPELANLAAAEGEARDASGPYSEREVIVGRSATRSAIERALRTRDVVHFGGHALVDLRDPSRSALVLAPDAMPPLTASAVGTLVGLRSRLLVLAACQSANGRLSRSEGTLGLGQAFLRSGVGTVVASLADLGDTFSRTLFRTFHERYAASGDAARALQQSQLALLNSGTGTSDGRWANVVVFGGWDSTVFETVRQRRAQ